LPHVNHQHVPPLLLQEPAQGVVEFGDAEDEPDYTQLAHKQHRRQQHKPHADGTAAVGGTSSREKGGKSKQQQSQAQQQAAQGPQQQQEKLAQHKAGELTHAEPNVPAESRLQLFGPDAAAGTAGGGDDGSWRGLGLSEVLAGHLEALNFQEPTQVR
jgi:hypothetical protein